MQTDLNCVNKEGRTLTQFIWGDEKLEETWYMFSFLSFTYANSNSIFFVGCELNLSLNFSGTWPINLTFIQFFNLCNFLFHNGWNPFWFSIHISIYRRAFSKYINETFLPRLRFRAFRFRLQKNFSPLCINSKNFLWCSIPLKVGLIYRHWH